VNVAKRLGAKVVVAHPGSNTDYGVPKQTRLEIAADNIRKVAGKAAESGIKIAVEPLPKQEPGNTLDEVLWIIERIDRDNVGINFDVNHLFPPEAIPSLIRKAGNKIFSVHISDQDGNERHWLPFMGALDWKEVLSALKETGYQGPLIYETHIRDVKTCEEVGRAVVENYKCLSKLI
jgi:sugar phosphate isomerase/epimerase